MEITFLQEKETARKMYMILIMLNLKVLVHANVIKREKKCRKFEGTVRNSILHLRIRTDRHGRYDHAGADN